MKSIADWQRESHSLAKAKGWHDGADPTNPERIASRIANIHAELSEALECVARGEMETFYGDPIAGTYGMDESVPIKPEGLPIELADVFLRLVDLAESLEIDLEAAVRVKHDYNKTRAYRHGGKRL